VVGQTEQTWLMVNFASIRRKAIDEGLISKSVVDAEAVLRRTPSPLAEFAVSEAP
jgi:hypothetical protein